MKKNTTMIKNELPELLDAVFDHPDAPEFLKDAIFDAFNERGAPIDAQYWRYMLEATKQEPERQRRLVAVNGGTRLKKHSNKENGTNLKTERRLWRWS